MTIPITLVVPLSLFATMNQDLTVTVHSNSPTGYTLVLECDETQTTHVQPAQSRVLNVTYDVSSCTLIDVKELYAN